MFMILDNKLYLVKSQNLRNDALVKHVIFLVSKLTCTGGCGLTLSACGNEPNWLNQVGPFIQRSLAASSFPLRPLEAISAGLYLPGQCSHWHGGTNVCISLTLFTLVFSIFSLVANFLPSSAQAPAKPQLGCASLLHSSSHQAAHPD